MEIRRASVADAAGIADVHVRTWQAAYADALPPGHLARLDVAAHEEWWHERLKRDAVLFVVEHEERTVAFVSVGPSHDPSADGEVYAIYALPGAWGSGAGTALMRAGVQALREAGYRDAILWVLEDNPRARRFYEREGWELDGAAKEDDFLGVRVAEVRYRLTL